MAAYVNTSAAGTGKKTPTEPTNGGTMNHAAWEYSGMGHNLSPSAQAAPASFTPRDIAVQTGTANIYDSIHGNSTIPGAAPASPSGGFGTMGQGDTGAGAGAGAGAGTGRGSYGGGGGGSADYVAPAVGYTAPRLPSATSQEEYIRTMYDASEAAARENLRAEYENNLAALDRAEGRLPTAYDAAADQAAAQAAINRMNFNEQAAATGLNTGTGSQARLSQDNALMGNISAIRRAQADAQADLDFQRAQLEAQYQQAIREAVAQNDLQKATALYQEARRVDESLVATAVNQANLDWNAWRAMYG